MKNSYIVNFDMQEDYKSFPVVWSKMPEELLSMPVGNMIINKTYQIDDEGNLKPVSVAILSKMDGFDDLPSDNDYDVISENSVDYFVPSDKGEDDEEDWWSSWDSPIDEY